MGLFRRNKNNNKPVIRQILDLIPPHLLQRVTQQYQSDKGCSKVSTPPTHIAGLTLILVLSKST